MTEASDLVVFSGNRLITTSLKISHLFGKRHDNVLASIKESIAACEPDFTDLHFKVSSYSDTTGRSLPMFELTRDAVALVTMSFTGAEAMKFKVRFIKAFNQMEAELLQRRLAQAEDAQILRKQLEVCQKRLLRVDKGAQAIVRLADFPELTHAERAKFAHMSPDRYRKEAAELMQIGLIDRPPVNQRMVEMAKKGRAAMLAKKAAALAGLAKDVAAEASSNVSPDASDAA